MSTYIGQIVYLRGMRSHTGVWYSTCHQRGEGRPSPLSDLSRSSRCDVPPTLRVEFSSRLSVCWLLPFSATLAFVCRPLCGVVGLGPFSGTCGSEPLHGVEVAGPSAPVRGSAAVRDSKRRDDGVGRSSGWDGGVGRGMGFILSPTATLAQPARC